MIADAFLLMRCAELKTDANHAPKRKADAEDGGGGDDPAASARVSPKHRPSSSGAAAVCEWVRAVGPAYTGYAAAFEANGIDGATLLMMDAAALTDLGVERPVHRTRLLSGIATLRMAAGMTSALDSKAPAS